MGSKPISAEFILVGGQTVRGRITKTQRDAIVGRLQVNAGGSVQVEEESWTETIIAVDKICAMRCWNEIEEDE